MRLDHQGIEFSYGVPFLWQPVLGSVLIMNVVLTPYILYLLLRLKKWGWIGFFCILIAIAVGIVQLLGSFSGPWDVIYRSFFFLFLVVYMYLLRLQIKEWHALAVFDVNLRRERLMMGQRNIMG